MRGGRSGPVCNDRFRPKADIRKGRRFWVSAPGFRVNATSHGARVRSFAGWQSPSITRHEPCCSPLCLLHGRQAVPVEQPLIAHCLPVTTADPELIAPRFRILFERFADARTGVRGYSASTSSLRQNRGARPDAGRRWTLHENHCCKTAVRSRLYCDSACRAD